ncbi:DUF4118 domain-containing protein [Lachnospiraceae bacterium 62-35]
MSRKALARNIMVTASILTIATTISAFFSMGTDRTFNTTSFYILAVVLIAHYTDGYVPGIISSFISVICVNFAFTYPYLALNFSISGYPITFAAMMLIASLTSTTTTHLKEKTSILSKQEKMLMEAEKEKMRANLLRAISHDLRTPLTSIIGTSSTYLENETSLDADEKRNLVKNIYDDSNWLLNMVENLLSVTRIRENGAHVTKVLEPLEEVISEVVNRLKKRIAHAKIQIHIPDEFIMIPMDVTLIEQVLINLLENGIYHSNSSLPLDLDVVIENEEAVFSVTDYGIGIKKELLKTIFDGYTSAPSASGDSKKGMGIGLSICKTIILAHGGKIWAENHKGGARFVFTLPLGDEVYES